MHEGAYLFVRDPAWRAIFVTSYAAWFLVEMWIGMRDRLGAAKGRLADAGSRRVIFYLLFPGLVAAWGLPYWAPWANFRAAPAALFWTAIALIWLGIALRVWAVLTLGRFFRTVVFIHDEHTLITAGPYRILRHPSYTGSIMSVLGIGLGLGSWLSVAVAAGAVVLAFAWRIRVEEKALAERFGDAFAAHRRRTWALLPYVW